MKKGILLFLLISTCSWAQQATIITDDYVYLNKHQHTYITTENDSIKYVNKVFEHAKFNSSNKLFYAHDKIFSDNFSTVKNIDAYTFLPERNEKIPVDHFEIKDEIGGYSFYSDNKSINFIFPSITKNAETFLSYEEITTDPFLINNAIRFFGIKGPIQNIEYTVEVDNNIELGFKAFNFDQHDILFDKKINDSTTVYTWKSTNIKKINIANNSLPLLKYLPHLYVFVNSYTINDIKTPVVGSIDNLYNLYWSWIEQIDTSNLDVIYKVADDITKDLNSENEKAKAIFLWVQKNISYISFSDGYNGFIPDGAANVYTKKYGDCKGMSNILSEMLNHIGIETYCTWIGSRNKPYTYESLPAISVDDHMIATAKIDGKYVFLDGTDGFIPYGMPSAFIQGKEALIGISDKNYEIVKVPEVKKSINTTVVKTTIEIINDKVIGNEIRTYKGYDMTDLVENIVFSKKADQTYEEYLNNKYEIGNNKTTYNNIQLDSLITEKQYFNIKYDLEINNYAKVIGSKIFINLNIEKPLAKDIIDIEYQHFGKKFDHKFERTYITTLKIPNGYQVKNIPTDEEFNSDSYGFHISYVENNGTLTAKKTVYINTLALENDELARYNNFIKQLIKAYKKSITLEKK